jgi:hypothetical protein
LDFTDGFEEVLPLPERASDELVGVDNERADEVDDLESASVETGMLETPGVLAGTASFDDGKVDVEELTMAVVRIVLVSDKTPILTPGPIGGPLRAPTAQERRSSKVSFWIVYVEGIPGIGEVTISSSWSPRVLVDDDRGLEVSGVPKKFEIPGIDRPVRFTGLAK